MAVESIGGNAEIGEAQAMPPPRLVKAAHEFEGQMMKELFHPMTDGGGLGLEGSNDDSNAGSSGVLGEFAAEALGQALSERGGFGIADRIVRELSHSGNRHQERPQSGIFTRMPG